MTGTDFCVNKPHMSLNHLVTGKADTAYMQNIFDANSEKQPVASAYIDSIHMALTT